jgi:large subunit ribosomal protein L19
MQSIISQVEDKQRKHHIVPVRTGDTVRVSQRIEEGGKSRIQVFEGLVIRTRRLNSLSAVITVRRIASGIGVEKTFPLHSPLVEKVEVVKRSNTRRKYLSFMRERTGKRARLSSVSFDRAGINYVPDPTSEDLPEEAKEAIETAEAEVEPEETDAQETDNKAKEKDQTETKSDKSEKKTEDKTEKADKDADNSDEDKK